jgi:hypothetical protein
MDDSFFERPILDLGGDGGLSTPEQQYDIPRLITSAPSPAMAINIAL